VVAKEQDYDLGGADVLYDRSGRPIRLFEGVVLEEIIEPISSLVLTHTDFQIIHDKVKAAYQAFWQEDETFEQWISSPLYIGTTPSAQGRIQLVEDTPQEVPRSLSLRQPSLFSTASRPSKDLQRIKVAIGGILAVIILLAGFITCRALNSGSTPIITPTATPRIIQTTTIDDSIQGTDTNQFHYVGSGWQHCTNCGSDLYDQSKSWDNIPNDYVAISFTGTQIKFYGVVGPQYGIGAVSIDGNSKETIDLYAAKRAGDQLLWTSPVLAGGTHTFELDVTGNKNPRSTNTYVSIDHVDILG